MSRVTAKSNTETGRLHVAIRHLEYLAGKRERPELGVLVQTHAGRRPVPWGQIDIGETVLIKLFRGPVVASAEIAGIRVFDECDGETIRRATLGFQLHELATYWSQLPMRFFAMAIFLRREHWLDTPYVPQARSRGASWIVAEGTERQRWEMAGEDRLEGDPERASGPSRTIPARLRFLVLRRDSFACTYCGRRPADGVILHVDHVVPARDGGATTVENLRTACAACNLGKGPLAVV